MGHTGLLEVLVFFHLFLGESFEILFLQFENPYKFPNHHWKELELLIFTIAMT